MRVIVISMEACLSDAVIHKHMPYGPPPHDFQYTYKLSVLKFSVVIVNRLSTNVAEHPEIDYIYFGMFGIDAVTSATSEMRMFVTAGNCTDKLMFDLLADLLNAISPV